MKCSPLAISLSPPFSRTVPSVRYESPPFRSGLSAAISPPRSDIYASLYKDVPHASSGLRDVLLALQNFLHSRSPYHESSSSLYVPSTMLISSLAAVQLPMIPVYSLASPLRGTPRSRDRPTQSLYSADLRIHSNSKI